MQENEEPNVDEDSDDSDTSKTSFKSKGTTVGKNLGLDFDIDDIGKGPDITKEPS